MNSRSVLLSTAYFAPVQYYAEIVKAEIVYIEQYENFLKQTYRNRCVILGANGPVQLIAPVVKGRGPKILIKDIEISYETDWQRNHWRTIFSAYGSSPFFEYYKDDILPFFEKKYRFLLDFNLQIHETICELLEIENNANLTTDFENVPEGTINLREKITPKIRFQFTDRFRSVKYTQVFSEKFGFVTNLSILDLLFNVGPDSYSILNESGVIVS